MEANGDKQGDTPGDSKKAKVLMKVEEVENLEVEDPDCTTSILCLLPEIWDQILAELSPNDFLSLINACPLWREMFKTSTTTKLLPLVVSVLINHNMSEEDFFRWRNVNHATKSVIDSVLKKQASPSAYWENLTTHNVSWSHSVEEKSPRRLIENLETKYSLLYSSPSVWNDWVTYLKPVLEGSPEINPFLTQNLHLLIGESVEDNINPGMHPANYRPYLRLILDLVGRQNVTSFTAEAAIGTRVHDEGIFTMLSCLEHLPLLKILKVKGNHIVNPLWDYAADRYPPLEHLETLDVSEYPDPLAAFGNWEIGGVCFTLLQRYGRQLKTFICSRMFLERPAGVRLLKNEFLPNLRCLGVINPSMTSIAALTHVDLLLEELFLSGVYQLKFRSVVRALNGFAQSLVHLKLYLRLLDFDSKEVGKETDEEDNVMKIKFPKLTKISTNLENGEEECFWQFVERKCDNLEEIVMHAPKRGGEEQELRIGFELVPKLKTITIYLGYGNEDDIPEKIVLFKDGNRTYERAFRTVQRDN